MANPRLGCRPRIRIAAPTVPRYRHFMVGCAVDENASKDQANLAQAEYYRHELSSIRARAEADIARRYIELQQLQNSGLVARAYDVRRVIHVLELEIATLERLGEGLNRWF